MTCVRKVSRLLSPLLIPLLIALLLPLKALSSPIHDLTMVGEGKMRWLFWELYTARLYSEDGIYQQNDYPLALAIRYNRDIEKRYLLQATVQEWDRLGIAWTGRWTMLLDNMWPSVTSGDELLLRINPEGISQFYFNGEPIGEIDDPDFSRAFLAIWLSPQTREAGLRAKLIGDSRA